MVDLSPSQSAEPHHQNDYNNKIINSMMGNDMNDACAWEQRYAKYSEVLLEAVKDWEIDDKKCIA